jgi:hypothetical protein
VRQRSHHRPLYWPGPAHVAAYVDEKRAAQLNSGIHPMSDIPHPGGIPASGQNGLLVITMSERVADPHPVQQQRIGGPGVREILSAVRAVARHRQQSPALFRREKRQDVPVARRRRNVQANPDLDGIAQLPAVAGISINTEPWSSLYLPCPSLGHHVTLRQPRIQEHGQGALRIPGLPGHRHVSIVSLHVQSTKSTEAIPCKTPAGFLLAQRRPEAS